MIFRPLNLFGFLAAATAGLHLYQTKHEVALLDRELRGLGRQIEEAQDRTMALNAEWAWLNEPDRLRGAAQRHLGLEQMQPGQFVRVQDLDRRLPAPVPYAGPATLFSGKEPVAGAGVIRLALLPRNPTGEGAPPMQMVATVPPQPIPERPRAPSASASASVLPDPAPPPPPLMNRSPLGLNSAQAQTLQGVALPAEPALPRGLPPRYGTKAAIPGAHRVPPLNGVHAAAPAPRSVPRPLMPQVGAAPAARAVPAPLAPMPRQVAPPVQIAERTTAIVAPGSGIAGGSALGGRGSLPPPVPYGGAAGLR
jgi:hypothetical protein